jgi:glycosyltransferase involved in cell wall biosynthesis
LKEAIVSVQRQTIADVEIIVGDDGDSSELADWVKGQARLDPRITYTKNPIRLGLAANWEACALRARGRYVTMIGDDDRLRPGFAERLSAAGAGADVVFCEHDVIDARGVVQFEETLAMRRRYRRDELPSGPIREPELWVWRNSVPMSSAMIRTEHAKRLGFKADLNTPEIEFFARLAREGGSFHFVSDVLAEYRSHGGSLTSAGLRVERLVKYLEPIPVPPEVEAEKRLLLESLCVGGLHRMLLAVDGVAAQHLARSRYYPRARLDRATIQRAFASVPSLGPSVYSALFPLAKRIARRQTS